MPLENKITPRWKRIIDKMESEGKINYFNFEKTEYTKKIRYTQ